MKRTPAASPIVLLAFLALLAACATSRAGWGKGRYVVVVESAALQVRRSTIRIDEATGERVLNWIGARAPSGQGPLAELSVLLFADANGDHVPQPNEVRANRSSSERAEKILFSDLRVGGDEAALDWQLLVTARTAGGNSASNVIPFRPDR